MLRFAVERLVDNMAEVRPLIDQHVIDVRGEDHQTPVDLQWYLKQEIAGNLLALTVRHAGLMVGYATVFFYNDQYSGRIESKVDSVYLHESYRKGRNGIEFLRYIERQAKIRGAACLYQSATPSINFGRVLDRLGYDLVTLTYCKDFRGE